MLLMFLIETFILKLLLGTRKRNIPADINYAIREGDGDRLIQLYKMALPIYYSHGRTKLQYTTLLLRVKTEALLSKRQAFWLKWNRFCNTKGRKGTQFHLI